MAVTVFSTSLMGKKLSLKYKENYLKLYKLMNILSIIYALIISVFKFILIEKIFIDEK